MERTTQGLITEIESRYSDTNQHLRIEVYEKTKSLPNRKAKAILNNILLGPGILERWDEKPEIERRKLLRNARKKIVNCIEKERKRLLDKDPDFFESVKIKLSISNPWPLFNEKDWVPRRRPREARSLLIENLHRAVKGHMSDKEASEYIALILQRFFDEKSSKADPRTIRKHFK